MNGTKTLTEQQQSRMSRFVRREIQSASRANKGAGGRSLIKSKNNKAPRMEPCETPEIWERNRSCHDQKKRDKISWKGKRHVILQTLRQRRELLGREIRVKNCIHSLKLFNRNISQNIR